MIRSLIDSESMVINLDGYVMNRLSLLSVKLLKVPLEKGPSIYRICSQANRTIN